MPFPNRYTFPSQTVATYDFVDVAQGKGILELACLAASGANVLTTKSNYADKSKEYVVVSAASSADNEFILTFNKPIVFQGQLVVQVPVALRNASGGDGECKSFTELYVKKNGLTLVSGAITVGGYTVSAGTNENHVRSVIFDLPRTIFERGSSLALQMKNGVTDDNQRQAIFFFDPANRTDIASTNLSISDVETTRTALYMPVEVNE